jgi:hypothetical protein
VAYPAVTFGEILQTATRQELEQFAALVQGYLSQQHDENGRHTSITGASVTLTGNVSAVNGTFSGNVTADSGDKNITLGDLALVSSNRPGAGIEMPDGSNSKWRIIAFSNSPTTPSRELNFIDRLATGDAYAFRVFWDTTSSRYVLTPGSGITFQLGDATFGRIADIRSSGKVYEQSRSAYMEEWITVAHNAANFTADSGNWTVDSGDQTTYAYALSGDSMTVAVVLSGTDVSATPSELRVAIPGALSAVRRIDTTGIVSNAGGAAEVCQVRVDAGETHITISRLSGNFSSTSSDNTSVVFTIKFEV